MEYRDKITINYHNFKLYYAIRKERIELIKSALCEINDLLRYKTYE